MPELPSPGAVIKAQLGFNIGASVNNQMVWHYRYSGSPPFANDLNAMAAAIGNAISVQLLAQLPTTTVFNSAVCTDLQGNSGQQGSATFTKSGSGGASIVPASACVLQQLHINARYRGGHPRSYWPGFIPTLMADSQHWATTNLNTYNQEAQKVQIAPVGQTYGTMTVQAQCVVSYYHNKALRPTPLVLDVVSRTMTNALIASQRGRLKN